MRPGSNRGERFIYLRGAALLVSCTTQPPAAQATDAQKRQALHAFIKCAIQHEHEMDDGISDASTVAFGLTNRCLPEYAEATRLGLVTNDRRLQLMWQQQRDTPQSKIEASLDVVLSMRRGATLNPDF
jgi:hypothetical protein